MTNKKETNQEKFETFKNEALKHDFSNNKKPMNKELLSGNLVRNSAYNKTNPQDKNSTKKEKK